MEDRRHSALIPVELAGEIVQGIEKIAVWIPIPRDDWPPVKLTRWERIRFRFRWNLTAARWRLHDRLFPDCHANDDY